MTYKRVQVLPAKLQADITVLQYITVLVHKVLEAR